ncbi:hypothetical protein [Nitrosospira sp. Nsp1]|uniref:hypothetical protein n=1 Tax=Nitrosospira sp. Nsp1 TaxID=136547 RepID=UPI0008841F35|nr:hypothetical protein [Nitrosospira sp. Nsp1]SCX63595.1 hypothetical protein SAMN05720354_1433 [Nitrosospira sp. Nsp1]
MSEHMNMSEDMDITENADIERKQASIRTALSVLAFSLVLPVTYYLWQAYCC